MAKNNKSPVVASILVAGFLIAGSLIYLGSRMGGGADGDLQANIEKGINAYVKQQQDQAAEAAAEANKPKMVEGDFTDDDPSIGDPDAPVTLIEFSDYQCPYCGRFFSQTLPQIKSQYIDTGKVRFVYRDFPLSFHPHARPAAIAAECARDQGGDTVYFEYHDKIFQGQASMGTEAFKQYAADLKLDTARFNECLDTQQFGEEVDQDLLDGQKAGVSGTPGFLLNGQLISGAQPFAVFQAVIEEALQE